jgi:hypothetical protein
MIGRHAEQESHAALMQYCLGQDASREHPCFSLHVACCHCGVRVGLGMGLRSLLCLAVVCLIAGLRCGSLPVCRTAVGLWHAEYASTPWVAPFESRTCASVGLARSVAAPHQRGWCHRPSRHQSLTFTNRVLKTPPCRCSPSVYAGVGRGSSLALSQPCQQCQSRSRQEAYVRAACAAALC